MKRRPTFLGTTLSQYHVWGSPKIQFSRNTPSRVILCCNLFAFVIQRLFRIIFRGLMNLYPVDFHWFYRISWSDRQFYFVGPIEKQRTIQNLSRSVSHGLSNNNRKRHMEHWGRAHTNSSDTDIWMRLVRMHKSSFQSHLFRQYLQPEIQRKPWILGFNLFLHLLECVPSIVQYCCSGRQSTHTHTIAQRSRCTICVNSV